MTVHSHLVYYLFWLLFFIYCRAQLLDEDEPFPVDSIAEFVTEHYPKSIRHRNGGHAILTCHSQYETRFMWEFKPCNHESKVTPCEKFYDSMNNPNVAGSSNWMILEECTQKRKCRLQLNNLNDTNNGLYRCVQNSTVIRVFELDVVAVLVNDPKPPEILSIKPENSTITQNTHLTIQCKVSSQSPPAIWWFKQTDRSTQIQYNNRYYDRINTSNPFYSMLDEVNVYLSKLNIYNAREINSGVYVCAAMTNSGMDYKSAEVSVISTAVYGKSHPPFWLLFLIPFLFALIPCTAWLCYYRKKMKHVQRHSELPQQKRLIKPVLQHSKKAAQVPVV